MTQAAPLDVAAPNSDAAAVLSAIRCVVQRLKSTPFAADASVLGQLTATPPAPRHMLALMRVVGDQGMSVSALADSLGISLATASQVVTDLETDGLVERYTDPSDRRRTLLRVGAEQRAIVDALIDNRLRPVQRALDRMRPTDRRALLRGLTFIAEELDIET